MTRNVVKMPRTIGKAAAVRPPSFQPQANFLVLLNCSKTAARSTRCIFAIKVGGKKGCTAGSKPPIADKRRQAVGTGSRIPEVYGLAMGNVGFLRRAVHVKKQIDVNGKNRVPLKTGSSKHSVPVAGVQAALGHSPASTTLGTYTHLWPDSDEVARAAISGAVAGLDQHGDFWGILHMPSLDC